MSKLKTVQLEVSARRGFPLAVSSLRRAPSVIASVDVDLSIGISWEKGSAEEEEEARKSMRATALYLLEAADLLGEGRYTDLTALFVAPTCPYSGNAWEAE